MEKLTHFEVTEFAFLYRNASAAFLSELIERRNPSQDLGVDKLYNLLHHNANLINDYGITKVHEANLKDLKQDILGPADS